MEPQFPLSLSVFVCTVSYSNGCKAVFFCTIVTWMSCVLVYDITVTSVDDIAMLCIAVN